MDRRTYQFLRKSTSKTPYNFTDSWSSNYPFFEENEQTVPFSATYNLKKKLNMEEECKNKVGHYISVNDNLHNFRLFFGSIVCMKTRCEVSFRNIYSVCFFLK